METLKDKIEIIDNYLKEYIKNDNSYQNSIFEAMEYSIFAGGKRLRPMLLLGSYEAVGGTNIHDIMPFACAIEMIHTYSLIHDDLPSMDNDDYRRGKLTNHKVYGDGTAILAGDGLLNLAFETMINKTLENKNMNGLEAMQIIAHASGVYGMIGGQIVDLESEHKHIDKETLSYIHKNKTAVMIQAPLKAGAILAGADFGIVESLNYAGYKLGMAFQIQDDILDVIGDEKKLGKPINSDSKNEKSTFVSLYGIEKSKLCVEQYLDETKQIFRQFGTNGDFLVYLTDYLVSRNN